MNKKPNTKLPLHQFLATGGKPKNYPKAAPNAVTKPNKKKK